MTLAIAQPASGNAKLGDAATTHAAQASCPTSCVFLDGGGCYAETGRQGMFVTRRLNATAEALQADALAVAEAEAAEIDAMEVTPGRPMRLHTVGDCSTPEAARIVSGAAARYRGRGGGPVWTYTHAWRDVPQAAWWPVSVLASCETMDDVRAAHERGYAAALVVEEFAGHRAYEHEGYRIIPCVAQTTHRGCSDCGLCFTADKLHDRDAVIAFAIHGIPAAKRAARAALRDPDDPNRRVPSLDRIRVIRDEYLQEHGTEPPTRHVAGLLPDLARASVYEWLRYLRGEIVHPTERRRQAKAKVSA